MANNQSLVSLKLDSGNYEANIKRAQQGLLAMEKECRKVGGSLTNLDKEQLEYIKSLGRMETKSQTARGKIGELSSAFTELRSLYNRLSEEEKRDEGGKAIRQSLDQLAQRTREAKAELNSIQGEISNNGSLLDQLSSKFGVNITQLATWGGALGAGKVALDVMKDAFFASEANLDDWNRAVYAGESAWDAFLTSLNTGDISGYLSRIDQIVKGAQDAYNELDRLSTQKAINNKAYQEQNTENERLRAMLRTGRYIAPTDGRKASMANGTKLTQEQLNNISRMLENGMKKVRSIVVSEIDQTTKSIDALYNQEARKLGLSKKEFQAGTANMGAFDERMAGYANYKQWENERQAFLGRARNGNATEADLAKFNGKTNPYAQYRAWGVFKDDGETFGKINELINQRATLQTQDISTQAQAYRAINKATGGTSGGSGGSRGGTAVVPIEFKVGSLYGTDLMKLLEDELKKNALPSAALELNLAGKDVDMNALNAIGGLKPQEDKKYAWYQWEESDKPRKARNGKSKEKGMSFDQGAKQLTSGLSSIGSGLEGLGIELGDGFDRMLGTLTGVLSIIQGVESIVSLVQAISAINQPAQTALLSDIAAATAVSAATGAIPFFHDGGIVHAAKGWTGVVPGAANGGRDTVPAMLSPQEVVLNAGQASNVAAKLQQGNGGGGYEGKPYIESETIWLGVKAHVKRTGQGEIITSKNIHKYIG